MFQPLLACGWCGGCVELIVYTVMVGGLGYIWPEVRRLWPFNKKKCDSCGCQLKKTNSCVDSQEVSQ